MSIFDDKNLTFYDAYESFCYQNCQRQILEYYKVKDAMFYINSSRSFIIRKQTDYNFTIDYDLSAKSILPSYDVNAKRIYKDKRNYVEVWDDNLSLINKDLPLIVGVDSYYLEYLPFYKKSHGKHTIILSGYCEKEEAVEVVDWFSPWFFKGKVNLKQFLESRDSKNDFDGGIYSGRPIYNNWAVIIKDGWNSDINDLIKETVDISIKQFYEPNNNDLNSYHGINAISYLLELISKILNNDIANEEKTEFLRILYNNIYLHNRRNFFFKFYLEQAYKKSEYSFICNAVNGINDIYEQWEKWLYLAIKCRYRINDNNLNRLLSNMKNIYEIEKKYENDLRKVFCRI